MKGSSVTLTRNAHGKVDLRGLPVEDREDWQQTQRPRKGHTRPNSRQQRALRTVMGADETATIKFAWR